MRKWILALSQEFPAFSFPAITETLVATVGMGQQFKMELPHSCFLLEENRELYLIQKPIYIMWHAATISIIRAPIAALNLINVESKVSDLLA